MEKIKQRKGTLLFGILLLLQCAYMIYWGTQKSGYYVDEFFTYDNTHYISESTPERVKLYDADFLEYEKWYDVRDIKSTLVVQRDESLLQDSLSYNIYAFTQRWPYMTLLNYVEAIFFEGKLSWWSAIGLNLVCFILNQILIYQIGMKICQNRNMALFAMTLYGFSGMAASMLVYVRMYMWLTLLMTIFTYIHVLMWDEKKHWKNIVLEILTLPFLYLAFKDSPLPVIYGVALIVCFLIGLLIRRKWFQALYYGIPLLGGGAVYAITQTDYVKIFMNPHQALESGTIAVAVSSLIENMVTLDIHNLGERIINFLHIICRYLFGHSSVVIIYIIIALIMLFMMMQKKAYPVTVDKTDKNVGFLAVLLWAVILYGMASVVFKLESIRYNSFVFPQLAVCIAVIWGYMGKMINKEKVVTVIGLVILIGEIFFTVSTPRVENLYLEDREGVNAIKQHEGIDSVVVDYHWDDCVMYECLAYTDENTKLMFTSYGCTDYDKLGNTILVWQNVNKEEQIVQDLLRAGYTYIDEIAETHESRVFLCKKES